MTKSITDHRRRGALCRRLSHGGKYRVVLGEYPQYPDVREFITPPGADGRRTRYINTEANADAKICQMLRD